MRLDVRMTNGYDGDFLPIRLPLPELAAPRALVELPYVHFTVLLDPERRLAALTAVNIAGAELVDVPRGDDWHLDDRIPVEHQAGPDLYARNDLDRGHLVRRRDPVWGADAETAEFDTFAYPNAAPQAARFNQSNDLWLGLEDHVFAYADVTDQRLSVLTCPVFAADDPRYRDVQIPRSFAKVVAWVTAGTLVASAFVLDQSPQLDEVDLESLTADAPPLGPFRTFQVPVADVAALTGFELGALVAVDVMPESRGIRPPVAQRSGWRELDSLDAVRL